MVRSNVVQMSLAEKMFIPQGVMVPCVGLPVDVNLDDIHPWGGSLKNARQMVIEGKSPSMFIFVENSKGLEKLSDNLKALWDEKVTFWLFYPKKPHLNTDLGRDSLDAAMKSAGMKGTRQVGIDDKWSCLYYKAK